jgi:anaerobic selenocysteine-containing dehydrogenase
VATEIDQLLLIGRRHIRSNYSWMHNSHRLVKGKPRWQLLMHPEELAARNLEHASQVRIESRVGAVQTQVFASDEVMPGVVSLPHGWGHKRAGVSMAIASEQEGVSCNDLTDHKLVDQASGNAALNGVPVRVTAA